MMRQLLSKFVVVFFLFSLLLFLIIRTDMGFGQTERQAPTDVYDDTIYQNAIKIYNSENYDSVINYIHYSEKTLLIEPSVYRHELLGNLYFLKGQSYLKLGEYDNSKAYLLKSANVCEVLSLDSIAALVNKALGNIEFSQAAYQKALTYYKKSFELEQSGKNPSKKLIASLFQNMGIIFSTLGNNVKAHEYFNKSILLKEEILPKNDPVLARGYMNFGRFLNIVGDQYLALSYLTRAEEIYLLNVGHEYKGLAPIFLNKGSIYLMLYDYDKALIYNERALELYRSTMNPENSVFNILYLNFGLIYERLDKLDKAIEYFEKSLNDNATPESTISSYKNLANCYYKLNDNVSAEKNYLSAIKLSEKINGKNHTHTATSYLDYGVFCGNTGQHEKSFDYLSNSLNIFRSQFGSKNRNVSNVLTSLGNHYMSIENYENALEYFQLALIAYLPDFNNNDIYINPVLSQHEPDFNLFHTVYRKAFAFYEYYLNFSDDRKDLEATLNSCELAVNFFEDIKSTLGEENTKLVVTTKVNEIYNLAVIVSTELYELTGEYQYIDYGFYFSEKVKAAVLLSTLKEFEALQFGNVPESIRNKDKSIRKEQAYYKNLIYEERQKSNPDSARLVSWKKTLFKNSLIQDSLIKALENDYSGYYNLKYNAKVSNIKDIRNNLTEEEALIEYKVADTSLIAFYITKDTVRLVKVIIPDSFSTGVENYINLISKYSNNSQTRIGYKDFIQQSCHLYDILIRPLKPDNHIKKLYIIPDDKLGYLNFETLVSEPDNDSDFSYKSLDYLIKSYSISYGYSGTLLFKNSLPRKSNRSLLAMAPSYTNLDNLEGIKSLSIRGLKDYLSPLEHTVNEAENAATVYDGMVFTNEMATEANFKANAHRFKILHLAMHTIINDEEPLASKLVFTLDDDTIEDGFLNTHEIYNLDLNAEMAVLSACRTGAGTMSKGEGIMSLARGFLYAGVPGIVMTLWAIEDISSIEIVSSFYNNLVKGLKKDEALRNAKLSYLESANQLYSHPYFWAAYVQIGDNSPVSVSSPKKYLYYVFGLLLLISVLFIFIKKV